MRQKEFILACISATGGGLIGGSVVTILSHFFTNARSDRELKRANLAARLDKVYLPIYNILDDSVHPGDAYEGIGDNDLNTIELIVKENRKFADQKLLSHIDRIKELQYYMHMSDTQWPEYDTDRRMADHIFNGYHALRVRLKLERRSITLPVFMYDAINKLKRYNRRRKRKKASKQKSLTR